MKKTRSTHNNLLFNGNMAMPVILSKKRFLVQNTCAFDAVEMLIATAYTNFPIYKKYMDENKQNNFFELCQVLAKYGATQNSYKNRVLLFQQIFSVDTSVTYINLIDARCNVNFIITSYLKYKPSAIKSEVCSKFKKSKTYNNPSIILNLKDKFKYLENDLKNYMKDR